jgi:hypothetical protein
MIVVLDNNEMHYYGPNKDHFIVQGSDDIMHQIKLNDDFKDDSIVDLASGTHFTILITKSGRLYCSGSRFLSHLKDVPEDKRNIGFIQIELGEGIIA